MEYLKTAFEREKELKKELSRLKAEIIRKINPERILLFGSLAGKSINTLSDLDLMIIHQSEMSFKKRMDYIYTNIDRNEETDMFWYTPEEIERLKRRSSFVRHAVQNARSIYEKR